MAVGRVETEYSNNAEYEKLNEWFTNGDAEKEAAQELLKLRIDNLKLLKQATIEAQISVEKQQLQRELKQATTLIKYGADQQKAQQLIEKRKEIANYQQQIKEFKKLKDKDKEKQAKEDLERNKKELKKWLKEDAKLREADRKEREKSHKEGQAALDSFGSETAAGLFGKGHSFTERLNTLKDAFAADPENGRQGGAKQGMAVLINGLANLGKQLENKIDEIGGYKTAIDTRLQGSKNNTFMGSYWDQMSKDITKNVGMSPLVKQADVVNSLKTLVSKGISYNVEQRAFLDTISAKIADTFSATDATLLKLVRIQQQDTTAARLGMESALTSFLNNMYETTEYMTQAAEGIRQNLYEASALMDAKSATAFEYQVQKWMGSLYSVGFDKTSGLSSALGKLAAGDISGLTGDNYGNLLIMAANKANLSIADILSDGLDDSSTNKLMQSIVEYLAGIYNESKDSKVISQQIANVYGLSASDLKAAANLAKSTKTISGNNLNYGGMISQLNSMANSMYARTSMGEMLSNMYGNFEYATASSIASNPVMYAMTKIATLLDDVAGGIQFGTPMVMGSGLATPFKVSDIMRVAALSGGVMTGIGRMIAGLSTGGGFSGSGMLSAFGVNNGISTVARGGGNSFITSSGNTSSEAGTIVNGSSDDIVNSSKQGATDDANAQVQSAQESVNEASMTDVNDSILLIHSLLQSVISSGSIKVAVGDASGWGDLIRNNSPTL